MQDVLVTVFEDGELKLDQTFEEVPGYSVASLKLTVSCLDPNAGHADITFAGDAHAELQRAGGWQAVRAV